ALFRDRYGEILDRAQREGSTPREIARFLSQRRTQRRLLVLALTALAFLAIVTAVLASLSRGAWTGIIAGLIFSILLTRKASPTPTDGHRSARKSRSESGRRARSRSKGISGNFSRLGGRFTARVIFFILLGSFIVLFLG